MDPHHLVGIETVQRRDGLEVFAEGAAIGHRHGPHPGRGLVVGAEIGRQTRERVGQGPAVGHQRIEDHEERAIGRHRLDHAGPCGRPNPRVERHHQPVQARVHDGPEFHHQAARPGDADAWGGAGRGWTGHPKSLEPAGPALKRGPDPKL